MSAAGQVKVTVAQGTVIGQTQPLPDGRKQYVFKGIPYAQPPIGNLRFQAPVPLEKFSSPTLDCSNDHGDVSFQKDMITSEFIGSENCLYLNVYTPIPGKSENPIPVMVWIHGGAFMTGSGNSDMYVVVRAIIFFSVFNIKLNFSIIQLLTRLFSSKQCHCGDAKLSPWTIWIFMFT